MRPGPLVGQAESRKTLFTSNVAHAYVFVYGIRFLEHSNFEKLLSKMEMGDSSKKKN